MNNFSGFIEKNERKIKITLIIIIVVALAGMVAVPIISWVQKKTMLNLGLVPATAVVKINGKEYPSGVYEIGPGEYEAEITGDGLEKKTVQIAIKDRETTTFNDYVECAGGGYECYDERDIENLYRSRFNQSSFEAARDYKMIIDKVNNSGINRKLPFVSTTLGFKAEKTNTMKNGKVGMKVEILVCGRKEKEMEYKKNFWSWLNSYGLNEEYIEPTYSLVAECIW